jgi:hypothetical protein
VATPTVFTPKPLIEPIQLAAASAVIYTVPASTVTQIKEIILVNDTTTSATATLYLCPDGDAETDVHLIAKAITIPGDGYPVILEFDGLYMDETDTIEAFASAANQVSTHLSGVELT